MAEPPASAETEKSSVRAPVSSLLSTRNGRNGGDGSGGRRSRRPFLRRTSVVLTESARRRSQGSGRGRNIHGVRSTEQGSNCCCSRDRLSGSFNRQGRRNAQGRHYWVLTLAASCILFAIPHLFDVACSSPPRARQPPEFTPEHTNGSLVRRNRKDTPEKGERLSWEQSPAGDGKTANGFDLRDGGGYEPPGNQVRSKFLRSFDSWEAPYQRHQGANSML